MRGISCATSAACSGSTSSWPVKRRCRADAPGGSEIMIGSIGTKATSPSDRLGRAVLLLARQQRRRDRRSPDIDRVEAAAAERQRADQPEEQALAARFGRSRASAGAASAASVMAVPVR